MHSTARENRPVRRGAPVLLAAGVLLLGACSSDDDGADASTTSAAAPETVTQTVTPSATASPPTGSVTPPPGETSPPTDDPGSCSGLTGKDAVMRWYGEVPLPEQGYPYAPGAATIETYDPCAALSSVILPVAHETVSSPTQVMLFHHGRYIGTATEKAYGFYPHRTPGGQLTARHLALAAGRRRERGPDRAVHRHLHLERRHRAGGHGR